MPIYISSSSSSSIMNLIVSIAVLAVTVGLFIFFLPVIGAIVIALVAFIALFFGWKWLKHKFGWESPDERMFRETMAQMAQMERNARAQFQDEENAVMSGVYAQEETRVTSRRSPRRRMEDVEDIEETPVKPNEK